MICLALCRLNLILKLGYKILHVQILCPSTFRNGNYLRTSSWTGSLNFRFTFNVWFTSIVTISMSLIDISFITSFHFCNTVINLK